MGKKASERRHRDKRQGLVGPVVKSIMKTPWVGGGWTAPRARLPARIWACSWCGGANVFV
ncbi:MAG: hypothetical protein OXU61_04100 [Gammaproteobacteria bacterium]|nr:hypothetical protein [Gammaproteobacteria bacterium]